jgi:NTP pyrophosphatase (non-canonical NTP hydrolase)
MPSSISIEQARPKFEPEPTVSEVQDFLREIYGSKNVHMDDDYIFGFITEKSGILDRAVTKAHRLGENFRPDSALVIRPVSWVIALANKHKLNLGGAFISKFPGVCPHCLARVCICNANNQQPEKQMFAHEISAELSSLAKGYLNSPNQRITLGKVSEILFSVYPNNYADWKTRPEILFSKLLEELGELREALRKFEGGKVKFAAVEEEIVDIFAWLCSIWNLVHHPKRVSLTKELLAFFHDGCPICTRYPCHCDKGNDRYYTLILPAEFEKLRAQLLLLKKSSAGTDTEAVVDNLIKSLDSAESEPRGFIVKPFFRDLVAAMKKISGSSTASSASRQSASSILGAVVALPQNAQVISKSD